MTAPDTATLAAILGGIGDSSDLTREQLGRAAWMLLELDDPNTRLDTGAGLLAAAESRFSGSHPPTLTAEGLDGPGGRVRLSWGPRMEDAARLWALCWACPSATVAQLVDVIDGRAFLVLDVGNRWTWHPGALYPRTVLTSKERTLYRSKP